jgi:hypothetical protein
MDYKFIELKKSNRPEKKYMAIFQNRKTKRDKVIHFGSAGMEDYTMHKDPARMQLYLKRHSSREDWDNMMSAGFWARWLLWSKPNYKDAYNLVLSKLKKGGYL